MANIRLYLDMRRGSEPYPLVLYISHGKTTATYRTSCRLRPEWWDERTQKVVRCEEADRLNLMLQRLVNTWTAAMISLRDEGRIDSFRDAAALRDAILGIVEPKDRRPLFLPRLEQYASRCRSEGTARNYRGTAARIRAFDPKAESLAFEDINAAWLRSFEDFLCMTSRSANGRAIHFRNIRAVFNEALDDEIISCYPFRKFKIRTQATRKRSLSAEDMRILINCECDPDIMQFRDMFVLMFCLIGINAADLLPATADQVRDGRLEYIRAKTGRPYSIKIEPEAQELLDIYRGRDHLLYPLDTYSDKTNWLRHMDRALKKIGPYEWKGNGYKKHYAPFFPELSQYWCRHTWATIAASLDIPKETIAAALGHGGNTVTDIYIDFDRRKIDAANRRVLDFVFYGQ